MGAYVPESLAIVVEGGFGGSEGPYKDLVATTKTFANNPATLVTFAPSWRGGRLDIEPKQLELAEHYDIPLAFVEQAIYLRERLRRQHVTHVILMGHSIGGMVIQAFVILFGDEFTVHAVVLNNSAGVTPERLIPLMGKLAKMVVLDDLTTHKGWGYWLRSLPYLHNVLRCFAEARGVARKRPLFRSFMTRIHESQLANSGTIPVFVGFSPFDPVFKSKALLKEVKPTPATLVELPGKHDSQNHSNGTIRALVSAGLNLTPDLRS